MTCHRTGNKVTQCLGGCVCVLKRWFSCTVYLMVKDSNECKQFSTVTFQFTLSQQQNSLCQCWSGVVIAKHEVRCGCVISECNQTHGTGIGVHFGQGFNAVKNSLCPHVTVNFASEVLNPQVWYFCEFFSPLCCNLECILSIQAIVYASVLQLWQFIYSAVSERHVHPHSSE